MTVRELARALLEFPNQGALVVLNVGDDWSDVHGVEYTGGHRNAVTLVPADKVESDPTSEGGQQ